jgi:GT2 family glycosyltransferase
MSSTPAAVRETELSHPLAGITAGPEFGTAVVLARWYSEPVAVAEVPLAGGQATAEQVARSVWLSVQPLASARFAAVVTSGPTRQAPALAAPAPAAPEADQSRTVPRADGPRLGHPAGHARRNRPVPDFPVELITRGLRLPWPPAYLVGRATVLHNAPPASVIVCTRDRGAELSRCLTAVLGQDYPDFEVIVVDNARASAAAELVARRNAAGTRGVPLRRVVEPGPGLSRARNAGLTAASGTVVAYLDDDVCPDRHWLAELARGFTLGPRVAGVSGLVLPAVLDSSARGLCDQLGGRGLTPQVFDPASYAPQHPLYPLPAFGTGGSIAFARAALTGIGGFDVALGAGTPAMAGDELSAICDLALGGGTFVYWPGAVGWHVQSRAGTDRALRRAARGSSFGRRASEGGPHRVFSCYFVRCVALSSDYLGGITVLKGVCGLCQRTSPARAAVSSTTCRPTAAPRSSPGWCGSLPRGALMLWY